MSTETVALLLGMVFAAIAVAGGMAYLEAAPRRQATVIDGTLHLRFSRRYRAVWIAILLVCLCLTVLDVLAGPGGWASHADWVYGTLSAVVFLVAILAVVAHVSLYRLAITGDGIEAQSPWLGLRSVRWTSVARVRYALFFSWFRVEGQDGDVIRASRYLEGIDDFAEALVRHLPPSMVDGPVRTFRRVCR